MEEKKEQVRLKIDLSIFILLDKEFYTGKEVEINSR